jgi:hypothetical protein
MSSSISGGSNPPSPPSVSGSYQGQGDDGSVDKDNDEEHTDEGVVVLTEGHDDVENGTAPAAPTAPTSPPGEPHDFIESEIGGPPPEVHSGFTSSGNPSLTSSSNTAPQAPSIVSLMGAMSNISEKKMKVTMDCLRNQTVVNSKMNSNAQDCAQIDLKTATRQGKKVIDACHKAAKKATTTLIINICVMTALVIAVVVSCFFLPEGALLTAGLVCACMSQAIVMTVTATNLLSPTGPIKNPTTRAIVTAVILLALVILACASGGLAGAMMDSELIGCIVAGSVIMGGTAAAVMSTNAIGNFYAASQTGQSNAQKNTDEANFEKSKEFQDINYALMGVSVACALGGIAAGCFDAPAAAAEDSTGSAGSASGAADSSGSAASNSSKLSTESSNATGASSRMTSSGKSIADGGEGSTSISASLKRAIDTVGEFLSKPLTGGSASEASGGSRATLSGASAESAINDAKSAVVMTAKQASRIETIGTASENASKVSSDLSDSMDDDEGAIQNANEVSSESQTISTAGRETNDAENVSLEKVSDITDDASEASASAKAVGTLKKIKNFFSKGSEQTESSDLVAIQLQKINFINNVVQAAGEATVALVGYFYQNAIIKDEKDIKIDGAQMAFFKQAGSFFQEAGKEISDAMKKDNESVNDVNDMFSSLVKNMSNITQHMGRM